MTEKCNATPIIPHHEPPIQLLRRPRRSKPLVKQLDKLSENSLHNFIKGRKSQFLSSSLHPPPPPPPHPSALHGHTTHYEMLTEDGACEQRYSSPYNRNDFVIHPLFPRGPPYFPPGKMLTVEYECPPLQWWGAGGEGYSEEIFPSEVGRGVAEEQQFTLNDFLLDVEEARLHLVSTRLQASMISRQNYLKLTSWFAKHVPQQVKMKTVDITGEMATSVLACVLVPHGISVVLI